MEDCVVYLVYQLRQQGYMVKFTWPNLLYVSWKHTETDYLSRQNPIIQAMKPEDPPLLSTPAPATKGKKGKDAEVRQIKASASDIDLINTYSSTQIVGSPFGSTYQTEPSLPRRAADYQPPAAFVQQLDRPGPEREKKSGDIGNVLGDLWK